MNGIIFFEDGTTRPFGQLRTVMNIVRTAQTLLPQLVQDERDQFLDTISKEELKKIVERLQATE